MALSNKSRRRWSLIILLVGLPIYIVLAISIVSLLPRPNILLELLIYVVLGIIWIVPFKPIFSGIGKLDDSPENENGPENEKGEEP